MRCFTLRTFLDKGAVPAVTLDGGADEASDVLFFVAELQRQFSGIEGDFGGRFGGSGAHHVAFSRGGEVANVWAPLSQVLEGSGNLRGWAFEGAAAAVRANLQNLGFYRLFR